MKTKIFLLFLLITISFASNAQTVTIPDANFVTWLKSIFPSCMNGNQMDTSCIGIKNRTNVDVSSQSIVDLTGIEYFTSLVTLNCSNNKLTFLPVLSNSISNLNCELNQLPALPALPNSITTLFCGMNQLTSLPTLPNSITELRCERNKLTSLLALPTSLITFNCFDNQLTGLPALPGSLNFFDCSYNQLSNLPSLPNSIIKMFCSGNLLTSLPTLPNSLDQLECSNNQLTSLPPLPNSLITFECYKNKLTNLPTLPNSLYTLHCRSNLLTGLPPLPGSLNGFFCDTNNISCFPMFPSSLNSGGVTISNNPFTCLPNYVSTMDSITLTYPLCVDGDTVNNPNGCKGSKGILGTVFKDNDYNCTLNAGDGIWKNVSLKLYDSVNNFIGQTYSLSNGEYYFPKTEGTYTVKIDTANMAYMVKCNFPGLDSMVTVTSAKPIIKNIDFNIDCKPGFDAGVKSVSTSGVVFPGEKHSLNVCAGNLNNYNGTHCQQVISGYMKVTVTGPVVYVSKVLGSRSPSVSGKVFTYNISDFSKVNLQKDFGLWLKTNTNAQSGDEICVDVLVSLYINGDNNMSNNNYKFCYNVVNSRDPNMKEVYPINVSPGYQDWFTYTIHFQNTGNAPAINITLVDTLNTQLNLETFQVINYSHYNNVALNGNVLTFQFPNIQLADSASNPEGSKGFVQYRIKPKVGLPVGTKINNTAYIYFDFNAPIVTNTTTNEYITITSIKENKTSISMSVYPNPGNGKYFIKLSDGINVSKLNIEVYNVLGEVMLNTKMQNNFAQIDLSQEPNGIYIVRVNGGEQPLNQRIIKE